MNRPFDLNDRLIEFAVEIIKLYNSIDKSPAGIYLADHMMRAGISPSLHYGEAQGSESRKDFIHKLGILIKELRETFNALKIIHKAQLNGKATLLTQQLSTECSELIAIFNTSIRTTKQNTHAKLRKKEMNNNK